jgi:predicted  nucleic acid-binding Zn-ribbon protein
MGKLPVYLMQYQCGHCGEIYGTEWDPSTREGEPLSGCPRCQSPVRKFVGQVALTASRTKQAWKKPGAVAPKVPAAEASQKTVAEGGARLSLVWPNKG